MTAQGHIYLTQDEADALPDGTIVEVVWSGGNGPHRYVVRRDKWGRVSLATPGAQTDYLHSLTFVGAERYHTRVRILEAACPP